MADENEYWGAAPLAPSEPDAPEVAPGGYVDPAVAAYYGAKQPDAPIGPPTADAPPKPPPPTFAQLLAPPSRGEKAEVEAAEAAKPKFSPVFFADGWAEKNNPDRPEPAAAGAAAAPVNKDPYGVKAAQKSVLDTYDEQKSARDREAAARETQAVQTADARSELARLQQEDAAIAHAQDQDAQRRFDDHLAETQRQLDAVRSRKIDPTHVLDGKEGIALVGGLLGGLYMGFTKGSVNPFIEDLNHQIEQSIKVQQANIDNERAGIEGRMNLLGQMRAVYKDKSLSEAQFRNIYYEAAKAQIESEAQRNGTDIDRAQADQAIAAINQEQKKADLAVKEAAQRQAQAAAAAAYARARQEKQELWEHNMKLLEVAQKQQQLDIEVKKADAEIAKGKGKDFDEQLARLGKALSDPKVVESQAVIDDLKKKLVNPQTGEIDGSRGVPGVGPRADLRESLFPRDGLISGGFIPGGALFKLSDEEAIGRQDWNRLFDAYKVRVTGAGASEGEIEGLRKSFQGKSTPAEQANAIRLADKLTSDLEFRNYASVDPAVAAYYRANVKSQAAARPSTVKREPVSGSNGAAAQNVKDEDAARPSTFVRHSVK